MPLDRRVQRLLDMLAASGAAAPAETTAARREALRALAQMTDEVDAAAGAIRRDAPGPAGAIPLHIFSPRSAGREPRPGLVFLHGGGWTAGGIDTHGGLCRRLAEASGARVVAVDYRLAPEHPFPAALDDAAAALQWTAVHAETLGIDRRRLAVGGDSAGGGLAAALSALSRDRAGPAIALQLLICPILDVSRESRSRLEFGEGYFIDRAAIARDLHDYRPADVDPADPRLSPLRGADPAGLPPTLLHTAEYDPFLDEALDYARRLREAGVAVRQVCHGGMVHYFYAMSRAIPHARVAAQVIGAQFREMMAGRSAAPAAATRPRVAFAGFRVA